MATLALFMVKTVQKWQKLGIFGPKIALLVPKRTIFGNECQENGPRAAEWTPKGKTKGIQSYLRTWISYNSIESGPSEAKKNEFWAQNAGFGPKIVFFLPISSTFFFTIMMGRQKGKVYVLSR